tara:strand:+ start:3023 stop:3679 length:657 start_codon:yes stop_codon:yes gene_type:complete
MSVWETLSKIDVSKHTEEKNGLTYLSWAWAWGIVKQHYPLARFQKNLFDSTNTKMPYMIDPSGFAFVSVTVFIEDEEQTELLPVLDFANKPVANPNSFQVNTALQRCLAKCCAMHGLGHYIYAGEDLPQGVERTVSIEDAEGNKKDVQGLETLAEVFTTWIPECADISSLRGFWAANKEAIEILQSGDRELYDMVYGLFIERSNALKKKDAKSKGEAA